jgi:hypothetical protein
MSKWETGKSYHVALSVDIDRFSDAKLRRDYAPFMTIDGRRLTPQEIRKACWQERGKGHVVFPPCDNVGPDGSCAGHPTTEGPK